MQAGLRRPEISRGPTPGALIGTLRRAVIGVLSALMVPLAAAASLAGAGWLVWRWQLRRHLRLLAGGQP